MPIYTYRCENCGIQFDYQQSYNDNNLSICPECEEKSLHRVYRPVGIVFKGSGFYATDNRSPSGQQERRPKDSKEVSKKEKTVSAETKDKGAMPKKKESKKKD